MNNIIAVQVVSGSGLVNFVVWLVVIGLVCWLLTWLIDYCGVPTPFNKVGKIIIAVVGVVLLINALLGLGGNGFIAW